MSASEKPREHPLARLARHMAPPRIYLWAALAAALGGLAVSIGAALVAGASFGIQAGLGVGIASGGALLMVGVRAVAFRGTR